MNSNEQSVLESNSEPFNSPYVGVTIDVASTDLELVYRIPLDLMGTVSLGTPVKVKLGAKLRRGWITTFEPTIDFNVNRIHEISSLDDYPLDGALFRLAQFGAFRYGTSIAHFLKHERTAILSTPRSIQVHRLENRKPTYDGHVLRMSPCDDVGSVLATFLGDLIQSRLRSLILVGSESHARQIVAQLNQAHISSVFLDRRTTKQRRDDNLDANCIVMTRIGVFAPIGSLGAIFVVDPEEKGHQNSSEPTWTTSVMAHERAKIQDLKLLLISGYPSPECTASLRILKPASEEKCWPKVKVIDIGDHFGSLVNLELIDWVFSVLDLECATPNSPVALVLNRKGKVNRFKCFKCKQVVRCELCNSLMAMGAPYLESSNKLDIDYLHHYRYRTDRARHGFDKIFPKGLTCPNCQSSTPVSCPSCKSTQLRALSVGTTRFADELGVAISRNIEVIDAKTDPNFKFSSEIIVGTESLFSRFDRLAGVAFVDFDQLSYSVSFRNLNFIHRTWYRSATALQRCYWSRGGIDQIKELLLVQTREPNSKALEAIKNRSPDQLRGLDRSIRNELGLPPFSALALVKAKNAISAVAALEDKLYLQDGFDYDSIDIVLTASDRFVIKASDHQALSWVLTLLRQVDTETFVHVDPGEI